MVPPGSLYPRRAARHSPCMRIRHATPADAALLQALQVASWQDAYAGLLPADWLRDRYPALCGANWHQALAEMPPGVVLLAEDAGRPLGLISVWLRDGAAHVDSLHIMPGMRGQGIGARLLGDGLACLAALGARGARLTIIEGNTGALRFYQRHGGAPGAAYGATMFGVSVRYQDVTWPDAAPLLRMGMLLRAPGIALRPLEHADKPAIHAINADAEHMRHFPTIWTREESDAWVDRLMAHHATHGFGFCALDVPGTRCAGVVGLMRIPWEAPFTPAVEIGWRILPGFQGRGLITRGAGLVLRHAFDVLRLEEVVSFTIAANARSRAVMERIGMRPAGSFGHPRVPAAHPMHEHLLYRITAP